MITADAANTPIVEVSCKVKGCVRTADHSGILCQPCFASLPEGAQHAVQWIMRRIGLKDRPKSMVKEDMETLHHGLARLAAELMPEPSIDELAEADSLTAKCHGFRTFSELINAGGGYFPKLPCSMGARVPEDTRQAACRLADLYDRAQKARGDKRRATRLGCAGL